MASETCLSHRRRFRTLVAFFVFVVAPLPVQQAASAVLTLDEAVVREHQARPDLVHVVGGFDDFSVDGTDFVTVVLAGIDYRAALSAFTVKGQTLRYRDKTAVPRLSRMRLNLQRRRFALTLRRIELGGVRSPLTLEIQTKASAGCTRVPLVETQPLSGSRSPRSSAGASPAHGDAWMRTAAGTTLFELAGLAPGSGYACGVGAATLEPEQLLVGDPATVRVTTTVAGTPAAGSVALSRADAVGAPQGPALCTLTDDGQGADAVAGDGVFSCTIQVDTSAPVQLSLVVSATIDGAEARSETSRYRVVAPLTDPDVETIVQVQALADQTWIANEAAYGDTLQARTATMAVLQALPGVDRVALSGETGSITIYYSSGVIGGLGLEPRLPPTLAPTRATATREAERKTARAAATPVADPPPDNAIVAGNRSVLIWDTGFFGDATETKILYDLYTQSTCPRFQVTKLWGTDATLDALSTMPAYGTVALITHGSVGLQSNSTAKVIEMQTKSPATAGAIKARAAQFQRHDLLASGATIWVRPGYIKNLSGRFADSIVWAGHCFSARDSGFYDDIFWTYPRTDTFEGLSDAYVGKGARAYFGFTAAVETDWAVKLAGKLFPDLVTRLKTTTSAFDAIVPQYDEFQYQYLLEQRNEKTATLATAHVVVRPAASQPVVYLKPTLTPKDAVVDPGAIKPLKITVEGADECTLAYRWRNTGDFGHLAGGDDKQTTNRNAVYQAGSAPGTDTITVDIIDTAANPARVLFSVETTIRVGCTKCDSARPIAGAGDAAEVCTPVESCCGDHADNDGDGYVDCDDPDCADNSKCPPPPHTGNFSAPYVVYNRPDAFPWFGPEVFMMPYVAAVTPGPRDDDDRQYCVQIDTHGYNDVANVTIQPPPYEYSTTLWEDYCLQLQYDVWAPTPQECGDWLQGKWILATAARVMPVPVNGTCAPWVLCSLADAIARSQPLTHWTFTARWAMPNDPCHPGGFLGGP